MAEARRRRKKKQQSEYFFDYSLLFIVLFLLGFGLIMIYSASSYEAYDTYGDAAFYMKKQLVANIIGLVGMIIIANIPYHFWERFAMLGYVVSMILIFLVKTPLGISSHGATRWIGIPHTGFNLQPAEVAKLCMILFLASLVCKMGKSVRTMKGFFIMMGAPLPIAACVYLITDNLSSAIIIMGIAVLMVFVASPDYKKFVIMGLSVVAAAALLVFVVVQLGDKIGGKFRLARIQAWLNPESQAQDKGFQTLQALYAIGSGGIWGKGLGQSMQKLSFLPEAQNDMIFSIICEELGLFGANDGHCQQCTGPVRRHAGSGGYGTHRDPGDPEHCGCDQLHSEYRNLPAVYQLRWFFGAVPFGGDRAGLKCGPEDPVKRTIEDMVRNRIPGHKIRISYVMGMVLYEGNPHTGRHAATGKGTHTRV